MITIQDRTVFLKNFIAACLFIVISLNALTLLFNFLFTFTSFLKLSY